MHSIKLLFFLLTVPKVSIDGRSHGDILLVAIGSGAIFAVVILVILISLIRHKKKEPTNEVVTVECVEKVIESPSGNFTLTSASSSDSNTSSKSNLMFRYFGKSLSSFDVEKSYADSVAINIELDNSNQIYRKQILTPLDIMDHNSFKDKYIQTISC